MKKQINPSVKAQILRSALILLSLVAVCAIPFALAQRNATKRSGKQNEQFQKSGMPFANTPALGQSQALESPDSVQTPDLTPWTVVAPYPTVIESPAVASDGTYAYAAGGRFLGVSSGFYRYDPVADTWATLAPLPTGLYDARAAYAANVNKVYVFGGLDATFTVLNTTYIYDIATNSWTTGAPMPAGRYFPNVAYYAGNGKIYVIGGFGPTPFVEANQTWEYDPVADTWNTTRASIPVPMAASATSIVGQNIYLAGSLGVPLGTTFHYRYDILANSWAAMAPVPVPVYEAAGAAVGSQTYVIGGGNPFVGASATRQDRITASLRAPAASYTSTYIYDTLSNSWTTGPSTNVAHAFTGGTAIGNRLLVVAGYDGMNDTNVVETATTAGTPSGLLYGSTGDVNASGGGRLWLIDVTSQSATLVGNTGFDRLGGIAFDSNGTLYGVSGGATHPPSTFLTIDPTNGQATVIGLISDPIQGVDGLRFNSQGVLYGVSWDNNVSVGKLLTIDPSNGDVLTSLTLVGSGDSFCAGIAFNPLDVLYGSRGGGSRDEDIDLIDPVTGVLTPLGPTETTISDIAFAPDGTLYGSSPNGNLYTIDPLTGAKTLLFNTGIAQLSGLAAAPASPTPTPTATPTATATFTPTPTATFTPTPTATFTPTPTATFTPTPTATFTPTPTATATATATATSTPTPTIAPRPTPTPRPRPTPPPRP